MLKRTSAAAAVVLLMLAAACANQKEPAQQALASVESSLAEVRDDATKFAKAQLDAVENGIATLHAKLDKGEYKEVIAGTPDLTKEVNSLKEAVAARKAEFQAATAKATEEWNALTAEVPGYVDVLQKRIDALVKSRKLEKGVSKETLDLDTVRNMWADAGNLFSSGQAVEASAKAQEAKVKAQQLADALKVKLGA